MLEEKQDNLINTEKTVFSEKEGKVFLGGAEIKPEILSILKDQAKYIKTSQLWDILHSTIINESARLAWESQNWDNVQYSKALKYWDTVFRNILNKLDK